MNTVVGQVNLIPYINFLGAIGILSGLVGLTVFKSYVKNNWDKISTKERIAYILMAVGWGTFSIAYTLLWFSGEIN